MFSTNRLIYNDLPGGGAGRPPVQPAPAPASPPSTPESPTVATDATGGREALEARRQAGRAEAVGSSRAAVDALRAEVPAPSPAPSQAAPVAATGKQVVLDHWIASGIDKDGSIKKYEPTLLSRLETLRAINPGSYALLKLIQKRSENVDVEDFFTDGEVDQSKLYAHFTKDRGKTVYGFYFDGEWREHENQAWEIDHGRGTDFLTAWGGIVKALAGSGYDALEPERSAELKENITLVSFSIAICQNHKKKDGGGSVELSKYTEVESNKGVSAARSSMNTASNALVTDLKTRSEQGFVEIGDPNGAREKAFSSSEDGNYMYVVREGVVIAFGIKGTDQAGKMRILEPKREGGKDNYDWTAWEEVTDDARKREYLDGVLSAMKPEALDVVHAAVLKEQDSADLASKYSEMMKKVSITDFELNLGDENKSKDGLVNKLAKALQAKFKGLSEADAKLAVAPKATELLKAAHVKLQEKWPNEYDTEDFKKKGFKFTVKDGDIDTVTQTIGSKLSQARAALSKAAQGFVNKYKDKLGGAAAAAAFYKKFEKMPFGLGPMLAETLATILGPMMKSVKAMIGGWSKNVKLKSRAGEIAALPKVRRSELSNVGKVRHGEKVALGSSVKLEKRVAVKTIISVEDLEIDVDGRKVKLEAHKPYKRPGNEKVILPKDFLLAEGTVLEEAEVLPVAPATTTT